MTSDRRLPFDEADAGPARARDDAARARAVDPRFNVALEASAGTGKTRVLVDRYINLLRAGVDPSNILAITFTRQAAAEMRDRILAALRALSARGDIPPARWRELRDRAADIDISTIDAFCLSLLREFPLEADLDPGFAMADDTEVPRLMDESLDRALRICRGLAREDEHVALVFAQLGDRRARLGLAGLLARRIVAPQVLARVVGRSRPGLTVSEAAARSARALLDVFAAMGGQETDSRSGFLRFVTSGPADPAFMLLVHRVEALDAARAGASPDPPAVQAAFASACDYFLTRDGAPRTRLAHAKALFPSDLHWRQHREHVTRHAPAVLSAVTAWRGDLHALVARGVWRMYRVAEAEYRGTLDSHAVLDFPDLLLRAVKLLRQMDEFSRSRYRLESRYHHVLVDEFQDTSRAQWELVALLVQAWGEGAGLAHTGPLPPSIFIVGDRKQSIYRFRDADVSVLADAVRHLEGLRPGGDVRRSISRSFRSVPAILAFVNDVCGEMDKAGARPDAFRYDEDDRFPVTVTGADREEALGLVSAATPEAGAEIVAGEIARLLATGAIVRDIATGVRRAIRPGDVAVLFRTRESHRDVEEALERRGIPAYVYKGLGFFDSEEVRDVLALLWHLADPASNLRAAAWLRSGFVRLSDEALRRLAPRLADALGGSPPPAALDARDEAVLSLARAASLRWRSLADRVPAAELLDQALSESAYAMELRGPRLRQARENLKKMRGLVRRAQNSGYATLPRIVAHLDRLAVGDESNAAIDARDAVNLMTVHASKGLEFPVVFVVNIGRGTAGRPGAIRITTGSGEDEPSVAVGDFESRGDNEEAATEREETKRLLYVALTRARDRLYLAAALTDGRLLPARGSLAEVAPASLLAQLAAASAGASRRNVEWRAASGVTHRLVVCAAAETVPPYGPPLPAATDVADQGPRDFGPVSVPAADRRAGDPAGDGATGVALEGTDSDRLRGVLLHRLVQRLGLPREQAPEVETLLRQAAALLLPGERVGPEVDDRLVRDAVEAYAAIAGRPEVRQLYSDGLAYHEVPFLAAVEGASVRGTIDCLVRSADGARVTVLEFKSGRSRPEHAVQGALYRQVAAALFPGARVEAHLVYVDGVARV